MIGEICKVIAKLAGVAGGLALIGVVVMWFGCIPMVACIFNEISGMTYLGFSAIMIILLILIIRWLKS